MWLKSELTLPSAFIWNAAACHHQYMKVLGIGVDYKKWKTKISIYCCVSTSLPSACGPTTMSWPVMTAMLLLVLSCTTIISIHRKTRKGGRSVSPIGLLFLAGVCLSLSVLCEHHRPTQNQNSNYCAVVKCVTKRTPLIWHQIVTLCLLKTIHGVLFKGLIWIAQMQILTHCLSACVYCCAEFCIWLLKKNTHRGSESKQRPLCEGSNNLSAN